MTTNEFFEAVNNLQINDLDMYNHVQQITDDFEPKKLQMLCDDFDMFVWRKIELSEIETHSGQSLYVSDIASEKLDSEQIDDLERLDDSTDDYSFDEHYEKYSYPTELKFLQRLKVLLTNLTQKHIISRNLSIKNESDVVKHPFDEYVIAKIKKSQNKDGQSNKSISFSTLDRIVYLTNYWEHADETVIEKLLDRNRTDFLKLNEEFKRELKRNIVLAQSDSSLKRLIKHYLFEMNDPYRSENKIENLHSYGNAPKSHKEKNRSYTFKKTGDDEFRQANKFQNYILAKDEFLSIIFESLRNCILKSSLSFFELQNEISSSSFIISDRLLWELNSAKETESYFSSTKTAYQSNNIYWLKSDESLEQFINALQEQNLIQTAYTEAIINNHFKPHREQHSKPEPMEWLNSNSQRVLVYLFRNLYKKYFINPAGKKWQLVSEHFIKENGKQFNSNTLTSEAYNQREGSLPANGTNIIDNIIKRLSE